MGLIANLNNYAQSLLKDIEEWKNKIAAAINTKGGQADPDSSFDQLAEDIATIPDFKLTGWTFLDDLKPVNVAEFLNNVDKVVSIYDENFIIIDTDTFFTKFSNLTTVDLPALTTISGSYALSSCDALTTVNLPALTTISGDNTFKFCDALTTVNLPALTTISGDHTLSSCSALTTVDLPGLTTILGNNTFYYCSALTINLPALTTISGDNTFYYCSALTTVDLPGLTTISKSNTFYYCLALTTVNLPALTTISGDYTFQRCSALTTVNLPALTTISGNKTFDYCDALTTVTFGKLEILQDPFYRVKNQLRNITIGFDTDVNLPIQQWRANNVIAEGQSGIDELNANLYNNLLTKLYDHSQDGETRTLRIGWLDYVSAENIAYATAKGWTLTT